MSNTTSRRNPVSRGRPGELASSALAVVVLLGCTTRASAAVEVVTGPTRIPDGEASAAGDLTVSNEHLAFALAVQSPVPYGVPRGAVVDLAPVVDGKPARDRVVFADFVPNNWSAWPNTYQKVDVIERGPQQAVVRGTRDWGAVTITTTYTLRAGSDRVAMQTTMTNTGRTPLENLLSGQTLWPSAGYFFGIPGLGALQEGPATGALADRVVAYDADWAIALHAPYLDHVGSRSKDLFRKHTLQPGESRSFEAWLQVRPRGDLAPVVAAEIDRRALPAGRLHGTVRSRDGTPVVAPVVVATRKGVPYAWNYGRDGRYAFDLPAGDYELYATGKGHSQSAGVRVGVTAGSNSVVDFRDVEPPGCVAFTVTDAGNGQLLDARIAVVEGQKPLVEFLGRATFFTELEPKGRVMAELAPGRYTFAVTSGGAFFRPERRITLDVQAGNVLAAPAALSSTFEPRRDGWYAADLHHHADQAEGVTPPPDLARSQLAAGLDLLLVSDHDSTTNHAELQRIADRRGVPLIPSVELSPSWGHFNAWPLRPGLRLEIDTGSATIDDVLAEARRQGATVVQSNHPLIPYGYLESLRANVVPGGFNPAFDLLEINADVPYDTQVLQALWRFWNLGHRYYMAAGTDVHDVWNQESGRVRTFAHLPGTPTPAAFAEAVKSGRAYVSYGPLIYPSVMFGSDLEVQPGVPFRLAFDLRSVAGLRAVRLIRAGEVARTQAYPDAPREATATFELRDSLRTWYSLEVEDAAGRRAYTNPIWIDVIGWPLPGK
ncbi:MAG TPA: CehA/McbA family metallohydrolase [Steroidobacteraceae bacterium]